MLSQNHIDALLVHAVLAPVKFDPQIQSYAYNLQPNSINRFKLSISNPIFVLRIVSYPSLPPHKT